MSTRLCPFLAGRIAVAAHSVGESERLEQAGADLVLVPYMDAAREAADRLLEKADEILTV